MNVIRFRCYHCYRVHRLQSTAVGRLGRCTCGQTMMVPAGETDETVPTDELPLALKPGETPAVAVAPLAAELAAPSEQVEAPEEGAVETTAVESRVEGAGAGLKLSDFRKTAAASTEASENEQTAFEKETPPAFTKETPTREGRSAMSKMYLSLSMILAVIWLVHTSPWIYLGLESDLLSKPLPEVIGLVGDTKTGYSTHYFGLERAFWSAILAGLALALGLEGWLRRCREPKAAGSWDDVTA